MAYRKPPAFVRKVFNPIAMKLGLRGTETLVVAGRRTGTERPVPVIPVELEGARYLVSPRGETDWVQNLRAAGEGELRSKRGTQRFRAIEVPAADRPRVLMTYRQVTGRAVKSHFESLPDPDDHPVFRIDPS